jgi:hypothetical protein
MAAPVPVDGAGGNIAFPKLRWGRRHQPWSLRNEETKPLDRPGDFRDLLLAMGADFAGMRHQAWPGADVPTLPSCFHVFVSNPEKNARAFSRLLRPFFTTPFFELFLLKLKQLGALGIRAFFRPLQILQIPR